jgi:mannose-1-phosphate guanylyltransferase
MLAILFAGGVGQRLWPLSRRNSPKQLMPFEGTQSSFERAVQTLSRLVNYDEIFIATNQQYVDSLYSQSPGVPRQNFLLEPVRRDVAAAVALAFFSLQHDGYSGPVIFQWADNYVKNQENLISALGSASDLIVKDPDRLVVLGEEPHFADEHLAWIERGEQLGNADGFPYFAFGSVTHEPQKAVAERMYAENRHAWNAGYFVTSIEFITESFRTLAPGLTEVIEQIAKRRGQPDQVQVLQSLYPTVPMIGFDEAILEKLSASKAVLLPVDLGWTNLGSLYSLKQLLQTSIDETVGVGEQVKLDTHDSLLYNQESGKLVVAMGLEGILVVNTPDVVLVVQKDSVRNLGKLLEQVEAAGWGSLL